MALLNIKMENETSLKNLLKELNSRNKWRRITALDETRQLPPEQLLKLAEMESQVYKQRLKNGRIIGISIFLFVSAFTIWLCKHINWSFPLYLLITTAFNFVNIYWFLPEKAHRNVAELLTHSTDIRLLGPTLSMMSKTRDKEVTKLCISSLKQILPLVCAEHENLLTNEQKSVFIDILRKPGDFELDIAVVRALKYIGDERAIPLLEKLTHINPSIKKKDMELLQSAADESLPSLLEIVARQKISGTLLRASAEPVTVDSLLRPAYASPESENDQMQLLRAESSAQIES